MASARTSMASSRTQNPLGDLAMATFSESVEKHHKLIIIVLVVIIVTLASSCLFHDVIPICHYVFGCDHGMHAAASP